MSDKTRKAIAARIQRLADVRKAAAKPAPKPKTDTTSS